MTGTFETAAGSVAGKDHTVVGKNNHDAFHCLSASDLTVAFVTDGCGSGSHSEIGAKIGVRLLTRALVRQLERRRELLARDRLTIEEDILSFILEPARQDVLAELRLLANAMDESLSNVVAEYFLFTAVGAIITPTWTVVCSIGDGVFAVNGAMTMLGPFPGNEPPYLAYDLLPFDLHASGAEQLRRSSFRFRIGALIPTSEVTSILIGTDGVRDLAEASEVVLPNKAEPIGLISQFWQEDRYFRNPDMVRRRLTLAHRANALPDDTTLVAIRRIR